MIELNIFALANYSDPVEYIDSVFKQFLYKNNKEYVYNYILYSSPNIMQDQTIIETWLSNCSFNYNNVYTKYHRHLDQILDITDIVVLYNKTIDSHNRKLLDKFIEKNVTIYNASIQFDFNDLVKDLEKRKNSYDKFESLGVNYGIQNMASFLEFELGGRL